MPKTKQTAKNRERIMAARNVFDYLSAQSVQTIEKGGSIEATVYAIFYPPEKRDMVVFPVPLPTGEDSDADTRRALMSLLGVFLSDKGVDPLMFISVTEAWSSKQARDGVIIAPSKDPKREEILIVSAKDVNSDERFSVFTINREKSVTLKKTNLFGDTDFINEDDWNVKSNTLSESLLDHAWKAFIDRSKDKSR